MDNKLYTTLLHLSGILLPLGPIIMWIIKKDESPVIDEHGKEASNWQLTVIIAYIIIGILGLGPLSSIIALINLVFCILAGVKANEGTLYRYPFYLKIFK